MLHYLWVQYAITGGLWAALIQARSLDALLNDRAATSAALRAGCECLEVVQRRGAVLSRYPETKPFLTNSALRRRVNIWMTRWMFRHDEYTKRCSAHAFGDPVEVKTFYDDLIATGRELGVSMPVMESYAEAIRRFAMTAKHIDRKEQRQARSQTLASRETKTPSRTALTEWPSCQLGRVLDQVVLFFRLDGDSLPVRKMSEGRAARK
jgi:hypothetical protein